MKFGIPTRPRPVAVREIHPCNGIVDIEAETVHLHGPITTNKMHRIGGRADISHHRAEKLTARDIKSQFFAKFTLNGRYPRLTCLNFPAGKFP